MFDSLQTWREAGGLWFVAGANILSGGVLPELLKARMRPADRPGPTPVDLLHLFVLMGLLGVMVVEFYAAQRAWFGSGTDPGTIAVKILCDQFGYTLFVAMPCILVWFAWKENGYTARKTLRSLNARFFRDRVPPMFVPNVIFWVPALVALYALPTGLQYLLFLFLNAAWCTLMVFIARGPGETPGAAKA